jgi:hypothetical protein
VKHDGMVQSLGSDSSKANMPNITRNAYDVEPDRVSATEQQKHKGKLEFDEPNHNMRTQSRTMRKTDAFGHGALPIYRLATKFGSEWKLLNQRF